MAGLLDELSDYMVKQSIDRTDPKKPSVPLSSQVLSALQGASNAAATNLSAPVDGIAWLLRKAGVPIPTNPVGGSDWMAQQGLTREPQNRNAGLLGEAIGGVLPMVAAAKAPQIAKGLLQAGDNLAAPATMNKQAGKVFVYPQEEALRTAQINAAKPVSEGGLGLHPNNTPMERAKALGFDTDAYHATGADFREFKPHPYRGAVSVAATPQGAVYGARAGAADLTGSGDSHVMPLLMRSEGIDGLRLPADQRRFLDSLPHTASEGEVDSLMKSAPKGSFWGNFFNEVETSPGVFSYVRRQEPTASFTEVQNTKRGADGHVLPNWGGEAWSANRQKNIGGKGWLQADESGISASVIDPSQLRSRFAAFDPARRNSPDLLAGMLPLGLLSDEDIRNQLGR